MIGGRRNRIINDTGHRVVGHQPQGPIWRHGDSLHIVTPTFGFQPAEQLRQIEHHFREPVASARIDDAPYGIDRDSGIAEASGAFTVGFAGQLDPQVGVDQVDAGIGGGTKTESTLRRVAPILWIGISGRSSIPRSWI